jgi:hypothetical protein
MSIKRGKYYPLTREIAIIQQDIASASRRLKNRLDAINYSELQVNSLINLWGTPTFDDFHPGISFVNEESLFVNPASNREPIIR